MHPVKQAIMANVNISGSFQFSEKRLHSFGFIYLDAGEKKRKKKKEKKDGSLTYASCML